ncbi:hypothetical protein BDQ17DRAFT_1368996 [Cyathus striatus]|nr:hypothetical protein BDQ17DRAFT_1368996 [Cyathus striatus]
MYSLGRATGETPILQTFQFHASDISNDNLSPITKLLSASPALREVAWIDDLANTDTMLELPLSRLTRLSLAMARGTLDYLEVLDQCPNLEHIRITRPCANAPPPRPPLLLAKLASLNISYDLTSILDHLILPALKHVRIHAENDRRYGVSNSGIGTGSGSSWSPETFLSLIDRSECSILSLSINAPMTEDALVQVLQRTSGSLTQLSVVGIPVTDKMLGVLTPPIPSAEEECTHGYLWQLARMVETRLALRFGDAPPDPGGVTAVQARKIRTLRILDGPQDLRRLQELKDQQKLAALEVIPRKESKPRRRNFLYRRKVCVSR